MISKNDQKLTYAIIVALSIVGIAFYAYAAINTPDPDQPLRIMLQNDGGAVWFDHQTHISTAGFGLSCENCHHHMEDPEDHSEIVSCSECHEYESEDEEVPNRKESLHGQCSDCHEEFERGPIVNEDDNDTCYACHERRF